MPPGGDINGQDLMGQAGRRSLIESNSGPGLPNESEGFVVPDVVRPYGVIAREAAERSTVPR